MRRRELIFLLGGAMTAAHALGAQQKAMPVIGFLGSASTGPNASNIAAFRQGLSETGYVEGQNLSIDGAVPGCGPTGHRCAGADAGRDR